MRRGDGPAAEAVGIDLRPRGVGGLLGTAFRLLVRRPGTVLAVLLLFWTPVAVLAVPWRTALAPADAGSAIASAMAVAWGARVALLPVAGTLLAAAFASCYPGVAIRLPAALRRIPALLGMLLLLLVAQGALVAAWALLIRLAGLFSAGRGDGAWPIVLILAYYASSLFLLAQWVTATPACVVERAGPWAALRRAWRLGRGRRLRVFGLYLLVQGVAYLGGAAVGGFLSGVVVVFEPAMHHVMVGLVQVGAHALSSLLAAAFAVALYFDLRVRGEDLDVERLVGLVDTIAAEGGGDQADAEDAGTEPSSRRRPGGDAGFPAGAPFPGAS